MDVLGPFEVKKRPLTLKPPDPKPLAKAGGPRSETQGLAAWWKFDETKGGTAADASGNRRNASVQGQPRWSSPGRVGNALELDGHSFVDCGGADDLCFREAMTLSVWLKVPRTDRLSPALVTKGNNTWQLQFIGEKRDLTFALTGPQTTGKSKGRQPAVKAKRPVDDGQWHHVAGIYDGQHMAFYLDGELEDSVAASGPIAVNTEPVMVGQNSMGRSRPFSGWIDDVRLYDRSLSAEEIRALCPGGAAAARAAR